MQPSQEVSRLDGKPGYCGSHFRASSFNSLAPRVGGTTIAKR